MSSYLDAIPALLFVGFWVMVAVIALSAGPILRARKAKRQHSDLTFLGHPRIGIDRRSK